MVGRGLCKLCWWLLVQVVAMFSVNTSAASFFRCQGESVSPVLNVWAQRFLRWAEHLNVSFLLQSVLGQGILSQMLCLTPIGCLGRMASSFGGPRHAPQALVGVVHSSSFFSPLTVMFLCTGVGFHGCGCSCHAPVMGFFCVLVRFFAIYLDSSVLVHLRSFPGSVLSLVAP